MKIKIILSFFGAILLSSCSLSPVKTTPVSTYTFTPSAIKTVVFRKPESHKIILVNQPAAAPGYATSHMMYEKTPSQLNVFADHRWIAPPADLLLALITDQLRACHYFHAVVTAPFSGTVNYQLNTKLLMLKQEFLHAHSEVRLSLEATLIDATTGNVIASRVFETVVPVAENNPYSGVLATNKAVTIVLNRIVRFVVANMSHHD